jgi:hypothetical protein
MCVVVLSVCLYLSWRCVFHGSGLVTCIPIASVVYVTYIRLTERLIRDFLQFEGDAMLLKSYILLVPHMRAVKWRLHRR